MYKDVKEYVMNYGYLALRAKFYKKEFLEEFDKYLIFPEHTALADIRFHVAILILASKISFLRISFKYRLTNPIP